MAQGGAGSGTTTGGLRLAQVQLSEKRVLASAEIADGQKEIVDKVFRGNVPFEAKKIFTNEMFGVFDRLGVANIRG